MFGLPREVSAQGTLVVLDGMKRFCESMNCKSMPSSYISYIPLCSVIQVNAPHLHPRHNHVLMIAFNEKDRLAR